jgi:hypothetical protein
MKSRLSLLAKNVQTLFRPLAIGCISAAGSVYPAYIRALLISVFVNDYR